MLAVMQNHQFHQPRTTPLSSSIGSSSTSRTICSNGNSSSFRTTSSGLTSVSSGTGYSTGEYIMSTSPTQFPTGKLHKRSQSSQTAASSVTTSSTEDVFAIDAAQHKKGRIKPLLKRVSQAGSNSGKLDLGKIDGGAAGGYYTSGRGSASDLNSFVPTHRQHHKRTISGNSSQSVTSPNIHPRRYTPTPTASYPNSIGDHSDSSDTEDFVPSLPKRTPSGLRNHTGSYPSPLSLPPRMSATQDSIASISPITPLGRSGTFDNVPIPTSKKQKKILGSQDASGDDFEENIRAAREAWERKEKEKEEKEEKKEKEKARKASLTKEKEGEEGSSSKPHKNRWTLGRHSAPALETEKTIGVPYSSDDERAASASRIGSVVMRGAQDSRTADRDKKATGVKNQWMGFVVWIKIGMVRIGRKIKFF